jgi:hypothetical protein
VEVVGTRAWEASHFFSVDRMSISGTYPVRNRARVVRIVIAWSRYFIDGLLQLGLAQLSEFILLAVRFIVLSKIKVAFNLVQVGCGGLGYLKHLSFRSANPNPLVGSFDFGVVTLRTRLIF